MKETHAKNKEPETKAKPGPVFSRFKKYFMYIMIAGFIAAALVSIFAVLIGEFNEVVVKSLYTVLVIVVHSLFTVAFMSLTHKRKADAVVIYTLFGVTAVSLINSILGIWDVISSERVLDVYNVCLYAVIAAFIIRIVMYTNRVDKVTRALANTSAAVTVFTFCLISPSAFINYPDTVPELYQRSIWATIILLVTLVVLTFIFNRLYLNQHPEITAKNKQADKKKVPIWVLVVIVLVCLPIFINIATWLLNLFFYHPYQHYY